MPTLRLRSAKGSDLTPAEADSNFTRPVTQKTTTYACLVGDNRSVIECNHATVAFTVTLGDAATMAAAETGDYEVTITNIGAAVVTVARAGSDTIDGAATSLTLNENSSVTLQITSGGDYKIINRVGDLGDIVAGDITSTNLFPIVSGTPQTTVTGTSKTFSGIPSTTKRITISFDSFETTGNNDVHIQLGDSGGIETTGYEATSLSIDAVGVDDSNTTTTAFPIAKAGSSAFELHGSLSLSLLDSSTNTWCCSGSLSALSSQGATMFFTAGSKSLSSTLTQIEISCTSTDTFQSGKINILYE